MQRAERPSVVSGVWILSRFWCYRAPSEKPTGRASAGHMRPLVRGTAEEKLARLEELANENAVQVTPLAMQCHDAWWRLALRTFLLIASD